jgi:hypothetical protein
LGEYSRRRRNPNRRAYVLSNDVGTNRLGHLVTIGVRKMPNTFED